MIGLCCALLCHLAVLLGSNNRPGKCSVIQKLSLIFTARCRGPDHLYRHCAALQPGPSASVCSRLLWLLKIKTGTMSSATSNTHLVGSSKSTGAVNVDKHCQWRKYCIAKVVLSSLEVISIPMHNIQT